MQASDRPDTLSGMSAPASATPSAPSIPHASGEMTEAQAIERFTALGVEGKLPEPKDPEELLRDEEQPGETPPEEAEAEPVVEGDEFEGEAPAAAATADPLVKFDDGTELPLSEVKRGWLRQADYTRKTQEVASNRKALESERAQFMSEREAVAERLTPLVNQARAILDNPAELAALNEMLQVDPGRYAVKMMERQARMAQLQQLEFEQRNLRENAEREAQQRQQQEREQTANASREALISSIPAFKKDFKAEYQKLGEYVLAQGVPPEVWDNEVDHRVITLAWKAMQFDAAARKAPATKEQLRKAPQPMRPGAARPPGHAQARALSEATERAAKSGSIEDAIKLQMVKQQAQRR